MAVDQIVTIKYTADIKDIQAALKQLKTGSSDAGSNLDGISKGAENSSGSLKKLGATIGISSSIMSSLIGVAKSCASSLADFAKDSIGAASDFDENMNKTLAVFGDAGQKFIDMSGSMASAMGMSKNQYLESISLFGAIGKAMNIPNDQLMTMSENLTGLATDLGSFYNKSTEQAMNALKGALTGETEALKEFGIVANETTMASFVEGQGKAWSSMTAGEKAIARYQYIMEQTNFIQGDFSKTSDGLANSQKQLQANMENLKVAIGTGLTPIFADLTTQFATFISAITMSDEQLAQSSANTQQKMDEVNGKLQALADQGITTGSEVDALKGQLEGLSATQVQTDKIQEMKNLLDQWQTPLMVVAGILGTILVLYMAIKTVMFLTNAVQLIINTATGIWGILTGIVSILMSPITLTVLAIVAVIGLIIAAIYGVIWAIQNWGLITDWIQGLWDKLCDWFSNLPSKFWEWFQQAVQWCKDAFNGLWDWFKGLDLLNMLFGALKNIGTWLNDHCLQPIMDWFKDIPGKVGDAIKNWGSWIGDTVKGWFGIKAGALNVYHSALGGNSLGQLPQRQYTVYNYNMYTNYKPSMSFIENQRAMVEGGQGANFNNGISKIYH